MLEEPVAAFYSWIANNFERSRKLLYDGQIVLVSGEAGLGKSRAEIGRLVAHGSMKSEPLQAKIALASAAGRQSAESA